MNGKAIKQFASWAHDDLVKHVRAKAMQREITKESQVVEEAAYTWFNRFVALRFMEANGHLPSHVRVFTNNEGAFKPQILTEATRLDLNGLDKDKVYQLKADNKEEGLFQLLLLAQCRALSEIIPRLFGSPVEYIEELIPDHLLRKGSIVDELIQVAPEEDWKNGSEILELLYEGYGPSLEENEPGDKKKKRPFRQKAPSYGIKTHTPKWISRYMAENTIGTIWNQGHQENDLFKGWNYYVSGPVQSDAVTDELRKVNHAYLSLKPEDITCLDPCAGAGENLESLFDVLMDIYRLNGYSDADAASCIFRNNLFGVDADARALQIAEFSLLMKARSVDPHFFAKMITPVLLTKEESRELETRKFWVVVTTPPRKDLRDADSTIKTDSGFTGVDLYENYMEHGLSLLHPYGLAAFMVPQGWMYLRRTEQLRRFILNGHDLLSLLHLGLYAFNDIKSAGVFYASFIARGSHIPEHIGCYCDLTSGDSSEQKARSFGSSWYYHTNEIFAAAKGSPVAYVVSDTALQIMRESLSAGEILDIRNGLATSDNEHFQRFWFEVAYDTIAFNCTSHEDSKKRREKWYPCISSDSHKKWITNNRRVVNWKNDGEEIRSITNAAGKRASSVSSSQFYFCRGITWDRISRDFNMRYKEETSLFDSNSPTCFIEDQEKLYYYLGLLSSCVASYFLKAVNRSVCYSSWDISRIPVIYDPTKADEISQLVRENIELSIQERDDYETSWNFTRHPLVPDELGTQTSLENVFQMWEASCGKRFNQVQINEEKINQIFISIYGLENELRSEVAQEDITIRRADRERDVKSLISYAIGCIFGRYSLSQDGVQWRGNESREKGNGILVLGEEDYFDNDATRQLISFIDTVYGSDVLEENLQFIAEALGGKGNAKDVIREYLLNHFYKDHKRAYDRCPIYWEFDAGKRRSFRCLIYIHLYRPDIIAEIRTRYIHELQSRYHAEIEMEVTRSAQATSSQRIIIDRLVRKLREKEAELHKYEEKIHHLADQMIDLDMDDGVKYNQARLKDVLA